MIKACFHSIFLTLGICFSTSILAEDFVTEVWSARTEDGQDILLELKYLDQGVSHKIPIAGRFGSLRIGEEQFAIIPPFESSGLSRLLYARSHSSGREIIIEQIEGQTKVFELGEQAQAYAREVIERNEQAAIEQQMAFSLTQYTFFVRPESIRRHLSGNNYFRPERYGYFRIPLSDRMQLVQKRQVFQEDGRWSLSRPLEIQSEVAEGLFLFRQQRRSDQEFIDYSFELVRYPETDGIVNYVERFETVDTKFRIGEWLVDPQDVQNVQIAYSFEGEETWHDVVLAGIQKRYISISALTYLERDLVIRVTLRNRVQYLTRTSFHRSMASHQVSTLAGNCRPKVKAALGW